MYHPFQNFFINHCTIIFLHTHLQLNNHTNESTIKRNKETANIYSFSILVFFVDQVQKVDPDQLLCWIDKNYCRLLLWTSFIQICGLPEPYIEKKSHLCKLSERHDISSGNYKRLYKWMITTNKNINLWDKTE